MPVDPSIYSQVKPVQFPNPVEQYATLAQLGALKDQAAMRGLQRQQLERGMAREGELAGIYRQSGGDEGRLSSLLRGRGFYPEAQAIEKERIAASKAQADIAKSRADVGKTEAEAMAKKIAISRDLLAQVNSDADMPAYRDAMVTIWGEQVGAQTPPVFDPQWKAQRLMTADQYLERMMPKLDMQNLGGHVVGVNPYTGTPAGAPIATTPKVPEGFVRGQDGSFQVDPGYVAGRGAIADATQRDLLEPERGLMVDPRTGQARPITMGGSPIGQKPRDIPPKIQDDILTNAKNARVAQEALELARKTPNAFGVKNFAGDAVMQRLDPAGVSARAAIADLGSLEIRLRSGAAVTAAEFPRLQPFIPSPTDSPETVVKKLERFIQIYDEEKGAIQSIYGQHQGFRPNPVLERGTKTVTVQGEKLIAKQAPDGKFYVERGGKFYRVE